MGDLEMSEGARSATQRHIPEDGNTLIGKAIRKTDR